MEHYYVAVLLAAEPVAPAAVLAVAVKPAAVLVVGLAAFVVAVVAAVAFVVAVGVADPAALVDTLAAVDFDRTQKHDLDSMVNCPRSADCLCLDFG